MQQYSQWLENLQVAKKGEKTHMKKTDEGKHTELGPNGYRTGYDKSGNWVEWIPDEEMPGRESPTILQRGAEEISRVAAELREQIRWHQIQIAFESIRLGEKHVSAGQLKAMKREAREIERKYERKYGRKNIVENELEVGFLFGKYSMLSWIRGAEWINSLDT